MDYGGHQSWPVLFHKEASKTGSWQLTQDMFHKEASWQLAINTRQAMYITCCLNLTDLE